MALPITILKKLLGVKDTVVTGKYQNYQDRNGVEHVCFDVRPAKGHTHRCPHCGRICEKYDNGTKGKIWRARDLGGIITELKSDTIRVRCPEHGIVTAEVPWAYPNCSFTKEFDLTVAWLAKYMPISSVAKYMYIDWETVTSCIARASEDLEKDRSQRLDGLVNIGIDETSYKKGHKYITIIVNHDTNSVVWVAQGNGKNVLSAFFEALTPEQRASIRVVTGDGARWITECVNEYLGNAERCVDPFHVVEWATEALKEVRIEVAKEVMQDQKEIEKVLKDSKTLSARKTEKLQKEAESKKELAQTVKGANYALSKAPENLTMNQKLRLENIAVYSKKLYRAYTLKEALRGIFKLTDPDEAEIALKQWYFRATHSRIEIMKKLAYKINRHKEHILNAIRYGMSNARIEATNNKIKVIIRKAYGFRNIQNLFAMIYLYCSDIDIPLPNRPSRKAGSS